MTIQGLCRSFFLCTLPLLLSCATATTQSASSTQPDLNGLWQAVGTAHWNLEGGSAQKGPTTGLVGALGGIPAGQNYVAQGRIPYNERAAAQRNAQRNEWHKWDPAVKCFMPGIPRQTYMPLPFHIVQSDAKIFIAYEWGSNSRVIHMDRPRLPRRAALLDGSFGWPLGRLNPGCRSHRSDGRHLVRRNRHMAQ